MKTLKKLGLIAITTLIIIAAVGCEDPLGDGPYDFEGTLTIQPSKSGPYTGKILTASYTNPEAVQITYTWYIDGTKLEVNTNGNKCTPLAFNKDVESRDFQVGITAEGYVEKRASIRVYAAPEYIDFLGEWLMEGSKNDNWNAGLTGANATQVHDETVVITATRFRLDNTVILPANNYTVADGHDTTVNNEYCQFTITNWETMTAPTGYSKAYKLTVNKNETKFKGYLVGAYETFNLYYKESGGTITINRTNGSGNIVTTTTTGSNPRNYVKQPD